MLTVISFILFTAFAAILTWRITRKDENSSSEGFFLGGRSLTFPIIAGSLLLTNLSTEQMVGLNGSAFKNGFSVMAWEVVSVIALVLMAVFFLPKFLRAGITTVPQFLEKRFDEGTQTLANTIFLAAYALLLIPIILYSGAKGLINIMDLKTMTAIESDYLILQITCIGIGIAGMVYARLGGLRTLAVLDTINGIGLLVGGFMIAWFALRHLGGDGGVSSGWQTLKEVHPERLDSTGESGSEVPFATLFTGVALLNLFYWCTNQQIIQRTFGASSLAEGQKGVLLTAGLKLLGPVYLVLPGIIAYHLYFGQDVNNDDAYGKLVADVLPPHLTGFFAAVMVGAILSSFNAALNSTSALFSIGLYKQKINPVASDEKTVKTAKLFVTVIAIAAMLGAPLLSKTGSLFSYLQTMNAIYFIPIFAVVVMGMLNRRVPSKAALASMVVGLVILISTLIIYPAINGGESFEKVTGFSNFHLMGITFVILVGIMFIASLLAPRAEAWTMETNTPIDMTPWKGVPIASGVLITLVLIIYISFHR
ncbi:solute:sodium symporter family transporter [Akkermansiaceae bacterium]|jgi:SSS family solute:Na+ symporter|nr:solute:sodium symporter family transporter [bacterium]MDA7655031.1 solute:sodium symporter family transporter [Akkermansiaceae bacterium]MDA7664717.1 solute:sodium symporter family transporter [Akkermansiaceae bacterium]MDA7684748.1 solute:sodium symporter family transporter [Akkermansiaceae bacterium]MDB4647905.1 solute:sodium symporter family transporter [Akkermansiaceae bacterium]